MRTRGAAGLLLMITAGCGGGAQPVTIRGDFADSSAVPERVLAVEASREAQVSRGAFELRGLSPGPATLRLVRGTDSTQTLAIESLAAGSVLELHGLKADAASGRLFPRSVALEGAPQVTLNGVRLAPASALPASIDTPGVVLALAQERDALLLRPNDASLPDLRVVLGLLTHAQTPDGDPVDVSVLGEGDSVRVQGTVQNGFVMATALVLPRRSALAPSAEASPQGRDPGDAAASSASEGSSSAGVTYVPAVRRPHLVGRPIGPPRAHGRGRGKGRG